MAALAKSPADEWLNRQGFFAVTGVKQRQGRPVTFLRNAPVKARAIELARNASVESAFRTVARAGLTQIRANLIGVNSSPDPEFVHQMRVGMRRFRSAFVAFRAAIPPAASATIRRELRDASRALGAARDWDVMCQRLAAARGTRFPERVSLDALQRHGNARRGITARRVRRAVAANKFQRTLLRAEHWIANSAWRAEVQAGVLAAPVAPLARKALKRLLKRALRCGECAAALDGDDRHRLRIRIKRFRYACEFFASLYPRRRTESFTRHLENLQDTLGELNDIASARRLLGDATGMPSTAAAALARILSRDARRERRLLTELDAQWKILRAADPFW